MPFATTFAGDSARAEGLFNISTSTIISNSFWVETLTDNFSTPPSSGATGIAFDGSGNVYICGTVVNNTTGAQILSISKYNNSGVIQWQRTLAPATANSNNNSSHIAVDSSGNVYICGYGYDASITNIVGFVAKYNTSGTIQWQKTLKDTSSGSNYHSLAGIALDGSGNIYVCGVDGALGSPFISKLNNSGVIQWQKTLTDTSSAANPYNIVVDSSGNVYVCGYLMDPSSNFLSFVAKYDNSGVIQWQKTLTDTSSGPFDVANGIAVDSSGNVYICGYGYDASSNRITFVAKYNTSGTIQWQRTLTDTSGGPSDLAFSIAVDSSGNVYICGYGSNDAYYYVGFVAKYNTSGTIQWQRTLTDTSSTPNSVNGDIAVDNLGNFYFCDSIRNSNNQQVQFIIKLPTDGSKTGTYSGTNFGVIYAIGSWTNATSTWTDAASTLTNATSTWSSTTSTWTDAASTFTADKVSIS